MCFSGSDSLLQCNQIWFQKNTTYVHIFTTVNWKLSVLIRALWQRLSVAECIFISCFVWTASFCQPAIPEIYCHPHKIQLFWAFVGNRVDFFVVEDSDYATGCPCLQASDTDKLASSTESGQIEKGRRCRSGHVIWTDVICMLVIVISGETWQMCTRQKQHVYHRDGVTSRLYFGGDKKVLR